MAHAYVRRAFYESGKPETEIARGTVIDLRDERFGELVARGLVRPATAAEVKAAEKADAAKPPAATGK